MQFFRVLRNKMCLRQTNRLRSGMQDKKSSMNFKELIQNVLDEHPGIVQFGKGVRCVQHLGKHDRLELGVGSAITEYKSVAEIHMAEHQEWIFPPFDKTLGCTKENIFQYTNLTIIVPNEALGRDEMHNSESSDYPVRVKDVKVVMPRCSDTAKGLLFSCLNDIHPCVFLLPKNSQAPNQEVQKKYYTFPLGTAEIISEGTHVTLVGFGTHVNVLKDKADEVKDQFGFSCEVIDLRTLLPWDQETVIESVKKTGRCIIYDEPAIIKGLADEIEDTLQKENEKDDKFLKAPIKKVVNSEKITFDEEEWTNV